MCDLRRGVADTGVNRITGELLRPLVPTPTPPPPTNDYKVLALLPSSPPFPADSYYDQLQGTLARLCTRLTKCRLTVRAVGGGDISAALEEQASSGSYDHI